MKISNKFFELEGNIYSFGFDFCMVGRQEHHPDFGYLRRVMILNLYWRWKAPKFAGICLLGKGFEI